MHLVVKKKKTDESSISKRNSCKSYKLPRKVETPADFFRSVGSLKPFLESHLGNLVEFPAPQ